MCAENGGRVLIDFGGGKVCISEKKHCERLWAWGQEEGAAYSGPVWLVQRQDVMKEKGGKAG